MFWDVFQFLRVEDDLGFKGGSGSRGAALQVVTPLLQSRVQTSDHHGLLRRRVCERAYWWAKQAAECRLQSRLYTSEQAACCRLQNTF